MTRLGGRPRRARTVIFLSQVYPPDPASSGQHFADVATELVRRGHRVIVYTANHGYDDPGRRYRARETLDGVEVRRLPLSSFGKQTTARRVVGAVAFLAQCFVICLLMGNVAGILVGTSPPMIAVLGVLAGRVRGVPVAYWVMDLNPDQMIALGRLSARSVLAKALERLNRFAIRNATLVVGLDHFMATRLGSKTELRGELVVIPPWPHEDHLGAPVSHRDNPFRIAHGLAGKFVVMYSGNHSPSNPLTTLLDAAVLLRNIDHLRFVFIGGGLFKTEVANYVSRHRLTNVMSLPYQPMAQLRYSLSAADVHVVSLGNPMVGISHPCKVYGAMAVARPLLYFGPDPSHIAEILNAHAIGIRIDHGDAEGAATAIRGLLELDPAELSAMGVRAREVLGDTFGQATLCNAFCGRLETAFAIAPARSPGPSEGAFAH